MKKDFIASSKNSYSTKQSLIAHSLKLSTLALPIMALASLGGGVCLCS